MSKPVYKITTEIFFEVPKPGSNMYKTVALYVSSQGFEVTEQTVAEYMGNHLLRHGELSPFAADVVRVGDIKVEATEYVADNLGTSDVPLSTEGSGISD